MESTTTLVDEEEGCLSPITITNYSKTQRIVLLLDLNPLLQLPDPTIRTRFLTHLASAAKTLISFPPLSSSLFSLKPFFSSLSPLLSSSKLPSSSLSLSFDRPDATLQALDSLLSNFTTASSFSTSTAPFWPRAVNLAASMRQLVHDYAWDPVMPDFGDSGQFSTVLRPNLVVLFSPIFRSADFVSGFLDLIDVGLFHDRFRGLFESVKDVFVRNDIHFSWVDVNCGFEMESSVVGDQFGVKSGFFEDSIRGLGWGFCSSDSIILGSLLVGFGLIYPRIGISSRLFDWKKDDFKTIHAQLSLEILDVSGKPLECKCCDLELINLDMFRRDGGIWGGFGDGNLSLQVKAVYKREEGVKFEEQLLDPVLVRECSKESVKDEKGVCEEFFADRVMEVLAKDMCEFVWRKVPIWQIFLSFLYREGYWALVSFSNSNGGSCIGILQPFTVFSALLCVVDDKSFAYSVVHELGGANLAPFVVTRGVEIRKPDMVATRVGEVKSRKNKKQSRLFQDMMWDDFCKVALDHVVIDMEDVYFDQRCNSSKKLKFLKCWMKQIRKSSSCSLRVGERSEPKEILKEIENRVTDLMQESERPIPSSVSVGEESLTGASRIQDDAAIDMCSETLESFFANLDKKMQQGLEAEGVDLGTLAERLVNSCLYWLYRKLENVNTSKSETTAIKPEDGCGMTVAVELTKLLLKEPKELINSHKTNYPSTQASTGFVSENIVREYELQILFRMEILQSEIGASIDEPTKHKFVKQICSLLEAIQCHLQGGFFGDWSLDNYVGKIIKSRYRDTLGDMVHRIYTKMDLLLFADEDESPNPFLNSEDSNQSWRERQQRDKMGVNSGRNKPNSVQDEKENDSESPQGTRREEHERKVMEARQRRDRARRFSSFTSWVPDLQRVWAPKQPKIMKPKSSWKPSKRKDRRSGKYDKVCETPMSGNKRYCPQGSCADDESHQGYANHSSGSVSKALFQDD